MLLVDEGDGDWTVDGGLRNDTRTGRDLCYGVVLQGMVRCATDCWWPDSFKSNNA